MYVNEDKQRRAEAFRRGECYNVFNVLGVDNMELSHSAFLAALLNPDGSHGMQDAFLKAFIDTIAHGGTKPELDTAHAKVYTEYNIGNITETTGGRIDILITDHSETGSGKDNPTMRAAAKEQDLGSRPAQPIGALPQLCARGCAALSHAQW